MAFPTGYSLYDNVELEGTTISNMVVYIPGSLLSAQFWATVRSDGGDIRATLSDGTTEIPVDVASFVYGSEQAAIFVGPISKVNGTIIRLWYNGTDTAVSVSSTYGRNAVWANYTAVYHLDEAVNNTASGYIDSKGSYPGTGSGMAQSAVAGKLEMDCAVFANDGRIQSTTMSNVLGVSAGYVSQWGRTGNNGTSSDYYQMPAFWSDSSGYCGDHVGTNGGNTRLWHYNYDNNNDVVGATFSTDTWYHRVWRHTGGTLYSYQDGSLVSSTASGNTGSLGGALNIGKGAGSTWLTGRIQELRTSTTDFGADRAGEDYANQNDPAAYLTITESGGVGSFIDNTSPILFHIFGWGD